MKPKANKLKDLMGIDLTTDPPSDQTMTEPENAPPAKNRLKSAPAHLMEAVTQRDAAADRADDAEARVSILEQELIEAKALASSSGKPLSVQLSKLRKVPGLQRQLTVEQRRELKENLRVNRQVTPLSIRPMANGGHDIISGNNRYDIYVELFAETGDARFAELDCIVDDTPDEQVEEVAYFANLIHPSLPAFEKYLGLKKILFKHPEYVQSDLAKKTGLAQSSISELLSFDKLPDKARELLRRNTSALGYRSAAEMSKLVANGKSEQVIVAIQRLVEDSNFTEIEAVKLATDLPEKPKPNKPTPTQIRGAGRFTYCTVVGIKNTLRLDFKNEDERAEVEELVKDILQKRANKQ